MKKLSVMAAALLLVLGLAVSLTACGGGDSAGSQSSSYNDGVYSGRSSDYDADEDGYGAGYGEVEITIADNQITDCAFTTYELDGTVKDDSYGADLTQENRLKAQKAVQASQKYAAQLAETGSLDTVDAISGATLSYSEFVEAVNAALDQARIGE